MSIAYSSYFVQLIYSPFYIASKAFKFGSWYLFWSFRAPDLQIID
jgi:hypothetical protein